MSCNNNVAINVEQVSKCYHTYEKPIHRLLQALGRKNKHYYREFWALKDISFSVERGETVGIVGQNGSGKSTLLQIIAGTLQPTSGSLNVNGRVAAILELGAGFNPEFNGIENARINAAIYGLSDSQFEESLDSIIEFSGLGDFIHQPVKTYSSGMYIRLAFSVSINLNPEILIIDEALAVGDARFQRKCFRKLESLKSQGVTILIVSHSTESIVSHCNRALFLSDGKIHLIGEPKHVVNVYLDKLFQTENTQVKSDESVVIDGSLESNQKQVKSIPREMNQDVSIDGCKSRRTYNPQEYRWGNGEAKIIDYMMTCQNKEIIGPIDKGDDITIDFRVFFTKPLPKLIYGFTLKTTDGKTAYGTNSRLQKKQFSNNSKNNVTTIRIKFTCNLAAGDYFISIGIAQDDEEKDHVPLDRRYDLIHLTIVDNQDSFGIANLNASIEQRDEQ